MKKIIICVTVLLSCFTLVFSDDIDHDKIRFAAANSGLMLRATPDSSGKKIALIPKGEQVELNEEKAETVTISGKSGKWSKIKWNGRTGWAFGGFLKTLSENAKPGIIESITGKKFSFILDEDERADEMRISIIDSSRFEGSCMLHGSGEAKFTGNYKAEEDDDSVTLILNGNLAGVYVTDVEKKITGKISKVKFIIRSKNNKFYGTLYITPCNSFSDREMEEN